MFNEIQENVLEHNLDNFNNSETLNTLLKEGNSIRNGDLVIHIEYGLGIFKGIENITFDNISRDFIKIEYADNASLLLPVENLDLITKYGSYNENIKLDKLSKQATWLAKKHKIRQKIKDLAEKLINIAYLRKVKKAPIFSANIGSYDEFCNDFMFTPTTDQLKAADEILNDLSNGKLMDRLLCGDVGFGKTEVAIRASFVVVDNKNKAQVAIIVPTTLLCRQHYKQFCDRFKNTNFKIACLSRFTTSKEAAIIKKDLEFGNIDIIIGTHSLLNKNIKFNNLGLVVIDEEQRFGVSQKEKIKELKTSVHILSMSATPIPRTLQMSISGIRDLSLITTPPINRVNVETVVCDYDDKGIKDVIDFELKRKGIVFIVVPRIADITEVENRLIKYSPDLKYCIVHGQMNTDTIDILMNEFYDGKYNVLISTTIIESGIDIPIANTIIIYRANNFGLSQLYQLRGRVGRSGIQAYAYLTTKKTDIITDMARKRLEVIESIQTLNSGFIISSEDMNIRGVGNVLGEEQSGHVKDVGIELYNDMLLKAMKNKNSKNNNEVVEEENIDFSPEIKLHISTMIPSAYIDNVNIKMKYYKEIADIENSAQAKVIIDKMEKEYGKIPDSVENLFRVVVIKNRCKKLNIQKLSLNGKSISVVFYNNVFNGIDELVKYSIANKNVRLKQDGVVFDFSSSLDEVDLNNGQNMLCQQSIGVSNFTDNIFVGVEWVLNILESCLN